MSWTTLQRRASELGFDMEFRVRPDDQGGLVPDYRTPADLNWQLIGNYEHAAGLWVKPRTEAARQLPRGRVARLMAECDQFVEPLADYEDDFFAAGEPLRAAVRNLYRDRVLS